MHKKVQVAVLDLSVPGGRALLLQTNAKRGAFWQNVTGSVDPHDTTSTEGEFAAAARREVREETGLVQGELHPLPLEFTFLDRWGKNVQEKAFAYFCRTAPGPIVLDSHEHQAYRWLPLSQWRDEIFKYPGNAQVMRAAMALAGTCLWAALSLMPAAALAVDNLDDLDRLDQALDEINLTQKLSDEEIKEFSKHPLHDYDYHRARRPLPRPFEAGKRNVWDPRPFRAVVKSGAVLVNVRDKSTLTLPTTMFVTAEEKIVGGDIVLIYDRQGKVKFETLAQNVSSIERDLDLTPNPKHFQIEPAPVDHDVLDARLSTQHQFAFGMERISDPFSAAPLSAFIPGLSAGDVLSADAHRIEYRGIFLWELPVEMGLALSYQAGSWKGAAEGVHWRSFHAGPAMQYRHALRPDLDLRARLALLQSLGHSLRSDDAAIDAEFSVTSAELAAEGALKKTWGSFTLGPQYRTSRASLKRTGRPVATSSEKKSMSSWALALGYTFDYDF